MGTSVSSAAMARIRTFAAAAAALALALGLAPMAFASEESVAASFASESVAGSLAGPGYEGDAQSASPNSALSSAAEGSTLASALAGPATSIVSADVALDTSDPIVGSFTVDGLTYALNDGGVTLVSVAGPLAGPEGEGSAEGGFTNISIPSTVTYNDVTYPVTAIGPYAFYLSGATSIELPGTVASVDCRAFRSSDVARVEVDPSNPNLASYEGCLYDSRLTSLLLIPEGRAGSVPIPSEAEVVEPSKFSHCSLVDAIFVDGDGADFASWEGLLYDVSGQTLLRVPAGATEIAIRDGCTTIAAGAMEGCAKLERINAPASVTSISPDVFEAVPTVSLPVSMLAANEIPSQIVAMIELSSDEGAGPGIDPSKIVVMGTGDLPNRGLWTEAGFSTAAGIDEQCSNSTSLSTRAETGSETNPLSSLAYNAIGTIAVDFNGGKARNNFNDSVYSSSVSFSKDQSVSFSGLTMAVNTGSYTYTVTLLPPAGRTFAGWSLRADGGIGLFTSASYSSGSHNVYAFYNTTVNWDPSAGRWSDNGGDEVRSSGCTMLSTQSGPSQTNADKPAIPIREGYAFDGWSRGKDAESGLFQVVIPNEERPTYYAIWKCIDYDIVFDVDSEPGDVDYPGDAKEDQSTNVESGTIPIEDPKRPGYVFEGWVIPNAGGAEAVDQDLVYQDETDGKWYVDASKLPDYAGDDGRVELTARWTSVISVDVPSSVTFYADLVTQGQQSREGAAEGAFGQNQVANQSQVDLRVVGLESSAVATTDTTLGADSILKKADATTPSSSSQKLLSLYPSTKQWTADELQDPDAVGGDKAASAVDFDLDDILLEKSFSADDFTIAAGGTLNMGYRLNLTETGQQLDYDKLATLAEGQSASVANVSYCFAADALPSDWDEPLWIENPDRTSNPAKYLLLDDIKAAADDLSANGTSSEYYAAYKGLLDAQVTDNGNPGVGPYFQLRVDGVYLPLQLIGICQDTKSDGTGKAGLTFQMRDVYAASNTRCSAAGGGTFNTQMNPTDTNSGGWESSAMRSTLRSTFWGLLPAEVQSAIAPVDKFQQLYIGSTFDSSPSYLQKTMGETIWIPSMFEVFGTTFEYYNESEVLTSVPGYAPFQYMAYAPGGTDTINTKAIKKYNGFLSPWWFRSAHRVTTYDFGNVNATGTRSPTIATYLPNGTAPCFCL